MKFFCIVILVLSLAGCVSGEVTVTKEGVCTFKYYSTFKQVSSPQLNLCGATLGAVDSSSDDEFIIQLLKARFK